MYAVGGHDGWSYLSTVERYCTLNPQYWRIGTQPMSDTLDQKTCLNKLTLLANDEYSVILKCCLLC